MRPGKEQALEPDPLWYKDAVIYELHVRAFHDSDGDGVGDFRGLTDKLDYLQDLGVTALWLLPFNPSPLRDDGYNIADYRGVHAAYGNLRHFRTFLKEAHRRGVRVITELVINHTSDEHPWFRRAMRARPGTSHRDFYVWSDTPERYRDARVIFQDFEQSNWTWHPQAEAYYWHRFYAHQPDLNYDNPEVVAAVKEVLDFWMDMGVDGMRLDAIPYLVEREGTNCENLQATHEVLKDLRKHLDANYDNRMLLAEANQWPEDAAAYFGEGDECHMNFHFPLMPRLFMAVRMEDRFPIIDILQQTPDIPDAAQWAVFLRNHDELTLEMVTDEERDYMYRAYAHEDRMRVNLGIRRRLAPLLGNNRRLIELLNGLLCSMPGTPVLYYGDEIGMGDNVFLGDRNGVRTPMQWSSDRNAGFSRANPQRLYLPVTIDPEYHFETVNVEAQQNNPSSLLWWMKRLIALRRRHRVFGRGSIEFLYPENHKVLAFMREYRPGDGRDVERVLVVANLSRFVQAVELDLSAYRGMTPVELFGRTPFPQIGDLPYFLTLGPHGFYWFTIDHARDEIWMGFRAQEEVEAPETADDLPVLTTTGGWQQLFRGRAAAAFERALPRILATRRWFGGKARTLQHVHVVEAVPVPTDGDACELVILRAEYSDGEPETYVLPIAFVEQQYADRVLADIPAAVLARVRPRADTGDEGLLFDAMWKREFAAMLLTLVERRRRIPAVDGEIQASPMRVYRQLRKGANTLEGSVLRAEQSNTSVIYGDRFILKLFRRVEQGTNPDLEVSRFLTERARFPHVPPVAGVIVYRRPRGEPLTLALLQGYVPNEGDAWAYTLDTLGRYYELALSELHDGGGRPPLPKQRFSELARDPIPEDVYTRIGHYVASAELLGQRTAELHLALASDTEDRAFAPEEFSTLYQRSLYQSMRTLTRKTFQLLRRTLDQLQDVREEADQLLEREAEILDRFRDLTAGKLETVRIRIHGDYHLGQVLHTGRDFVIIDFEGEPARPLGERRLKRSPLRDVAGMLRSFHYAAYAGLFEQDERGVIGGPDQRAGLELWTRYWHTWISAAYLHRYLATAGRVAFIPNGHDEMCTLLDAYLLEKGIYELAYELNNRPTWVRIPLQGVLQLLAPRTP
ncbi:MAG TPA: maltose alpha-D-glucosyltransferase [Nitriliruptorales bacterium]|nr:maltose alpha-D-glucosyltransferase [Nitriliruptorales bacterium]